MSEEEKKQGQKKDKAWLDKYMVKPDKKDEKEIVIDEDEIVFDDELFGQEEDVLTKGPSEKPKEEEVEPVDKPKVVEKEDILEDSEPEEVMSFEEFRREFEGPKVPGAEELEELQHGVSKLSFFLLITLLLTSGFALGIAIVQVYNIALPDFLINILTKFG